MDFEASDTPDGRYYYMTFSSFQASPGVIIWQSRVLVNWVPVCAALSKPPGSVWVRTALNKRNSPPLFDDFRYRGPGDMV